MEDWLYIWTKEEESVMNTSVSLKNLVYRIELDKKFMKEHPEKKEMLQRHIDDQKSYIIQCVLENSKNPLLDKIKMI